MMDIFLIYIGGMATSLLIMIVHSAPYAYYRTHRSWSRLTGFMIGSLLLWPFTLIAIGLGVYQRKKGGWYD